MDRSSCIYYHTTSLPVNYLQQWTGLTTQTCRIFALPHENMSWCQVGSSPSCSLPPYESNSFNHRDVTEAKHIRHLRFILGGLKSDIFSARTHQELMSLIPRKWQSSSQYMVYNGTTLSPRSTVHGLHLQDDQVGDIHLALRMRGGGNLCECGDRESSVQSQPTQKDQKTSSQRTRKEGAAGEDAEVEAHTESETEDGIETELSSSSQCTQEMPTAGEDSEIEARAENETEAEIETELSIAQFSELRSAPNMLL